MPQGTNNDTLLYFSRASLISARARVPPCSGGIGEALAAKLVYKDEMSQNQSVCLQVIETIAFEIGHESHLGTRPGLTSSLGPIHRKSLVANTIESTIFKSIPYSNGNQETF